MVNDVCFIGSLGLQAKHGISVPTIRTSSKSGMCAQVKTTRTIVINNDSNSNINSSHYNYYYNYNNNNNNNYYYYYHHHSNNNNNARDVHQLLIGEYCGTIL